MILCPFGRASAVLTVLALAALDSLVFSAEADQFMGEAALRQGDYGNAVHFFENMLRQADEVQNKDQWAVNALRLGAARLAAGDLQGAKEILAEFRRRNPVLSAGTLPGDIFIAENRIAEATRFFSVLAQSQDPEESAAARFRLAELRLRASDPAGAEKIFADIRKKAPPAWQTRAAYEQIYCLIGQKRFEEAGKELKKFPGKARTEQYQEARLAVSVGSGSLAEFRHAWPALQAALIPAPDRRKCELLRSAADLAGREKDYTLARRTLLEALDFAPDPEMRRAVLKQLINLLAVSTPAEAAYAINRYWEDFPSLADRIQLSLQGGRLQNQAGNTVEALDFYRRILRMNGVPLSDQLKAASEAASVAENAGYRAEAAALFDYLTDRAPSRAEKFRQHCAYGEFLLRNSGAAQAVRQFQYALKSAAGKESETARHGLLRARVAAGDDTEARKEAALLLKSTDPEMSSFARFQLARLAENSGQLLEARRLYGELQKKEAVKNYRPAASYAAAELALKLKLYPDAIKEFMGFAAEWPKEKEAPSALFAALRAAQFDKNIQAEEKCFQSLLKNYHGSREMVAAVFDAAEKKNEAGEFDAALNLLALLAEGPAAKTLSAELALQRARILQRAGRLAEAADEIRKVLSSAPAAELAADAALLGGTISFDRGDYAEALRLYGRAAELRPGGLFGEVARGRMCDCELVLFGSGNRPELERAAERCGKLAETSRYPGIRLQSQYKYGRFQELLGNQNAAVQAYERVLYLAAEQRRQGLTPENSWCVRAAHAALQIYGTRPDGLRRSLRLISRYEALKLPDTGEDFAALRSSVRKNMPR